MFELHDVVECLWRFDGIRFPVNIASILREQHSIRSWKYLLKTPGNAISETLNFKMSLDALALKKLCFWFKFQSAYYSIWACYLKTFLTALVISL